MNYACTTTFSICYLILQLNTVSQQVFGASLSSSHEANSTDDLMTVEKSLIVAGVPSTSGGFVVSDVDHLEKSVFTFEKNESTQNNSLVRGKNTSVTIPEISNVENTINNTLVRRLNTTSEESYVKVTTNATLRDNFTASPYLGSIPDDYMNKYRDNHGVVKINSGGGIRERPFSIGTVSEPIYFNAFSRPGPNNNTSLDKKESGDWRPKGYTYDHQRHGSNTGTQNNVSVDKKESIDWSSKGSKYDQRPGSNTQNNTSVDNKESVDWGSKGYKYDQKRIKFEKNNVSSIKIYPDVKPEESVNSFPYHYEGGEPKISYSTGSVSVGPDSSKIANSQGYLVDPRHVEDFNNLNDQDYPRIPVSPPPWMVPPPHHHHDITSNVRFPHVSNLAAVEKPVRFEQNIESVVFTTELPRRGQLETPSVSSGLYPEPHGYDVYSYGSTHKMSTMSQALKFLATIVPLGLFVAALTPAVVNVNATQGVMRRRPQHLGEVSGGREVSDRLPSGAANSGLEAEQCDMREVCEAALRGVANNDSGTIEERVYWILSQKSLKTELTTYALDELFSVIRRKSCSSFSCNSLSQEAIDKWTITTTSSPPLSSTQETSTTPKKIKRKKKKIPPVT